MQAAERIYSLLLAKGSRQVRLHRGEILSYPAEAPRGYGVHGSLVGVYTPAAKMEWLIEDISIALHEGGRNASA